MHRKKWPVPTGPRLAIVPGRGLGPIRLGASIGTVERLMQLRCDEKSDDRCRYVTRAVDFHLSKGVVTKIVVHRKGRPAGKDIAGNPRTFGIFNGAMPPHNIVPGMLESAVQELLPKPKRVEEVSDDRGYGTVEVHDYDGMRLEYDAIPDRGTVLGAIQIFK